MLTIIGDVARVRRVRPTLLACWLAVALAGCPRDPKGAGTVPPTPEPATGSALHCEGATYTVTTGTADGSCTSSHGTDGHVESISCASGDGKNTANASCKNGIGSCETTTGAGKCDIKAD